MPWKALGENLPKDNFFSVQAHCRKTQATSKEQATAIPEAPSSHYQEAQTISGPTELIALGNLNGLWNFWNTHA